MTDVLTRAEGYLEQAGLLDVTGAVLYSAPETIARAPVYIMGLNPGGGGGHSLRESIARSRSNGKNAYLDECWVQGRRGVIPAGEATLQQRMQWVARLLGLSLRDIPASNLVFSQSRRVQTHHGFANTAELCWPVHEMFLSEIRPNLVFTYGSFDHFRPFIECSEHEEKDARWAGWQAHRGHGKVSKIRFRFGNVPHLSVWGGENREDILRWALFKD